MPEPDNTLRDQYVTEWVWMLSIWSEGHWFKSHSQQSDFTKGPQTRALNPWLHQELADPAKPLRIKGLLDK